MLILVKLILSIYSFNCSSTVRRIRVMDAWNHGSSWNRLPQGQKLQNIRDEDEMHNNLNEEVCEGNSYINGRLPQERDIKYQQTISR